MHDLFWAHGHIGWPLFCAVVFTAVLGLAVDYSWRVLRMRSAYLGLVSVALWLCGILAIALITSGLR